MSTELNFKKFKVDNVEKHMARLSGANNTLVSVAAFQDCVYVNIREHFWSKGTLLPTKTGATLSSDEWLDMCKSAPKPVEEELERIRIQIESRIHQAKPYKAYECDKVEVWVSESMDLSDSPGNVMLVRQRKGRGESRITLTYEKWKQLIDGQAQINALLKKAKKESNEVAEATWQRAIQTEDAETRWQRGIQNEESIVN
jgi:hypothetical protein